MPRRYLVAADLSYSESADNAVCYDMDTMHNSQKKTSCDGCGSCCRQGGPALHSQDLTLVQDGVLRLEDLLTVRRGELALHPLSGEPQQVTAEFLKLKGQGSDWCCRFYNFEEKGCTIYEHRPVACRLLDCTHPDELLAVAGQDLLNRIDLITADDPLLSLVKLHEKHCACPPLDGLVNRLAADAENGMEDMTRLINFDIAVRGKAIRELSLSVDLELFYFGTPLFQLLQLLGFVVTESVQGLQLHHDFQGQH